MMEAKFNATREGWYDPKIAPGVIWIDIKIHINNNTEFGPVGTLIDGYRYALTIAATVQAAQAVGHGSSRWTSRRACHVPDHRRSFFTVVRKENTERPSSFHSVAEAHDKTTYATRPEPTTR